MRAQKIFIYNYKALFEILNEIKEIVNFDIIEVNQKNYENLKDDIKNNIVVTSKSINSDFKNQLTIDDLPIKIDKLVQEINLRFLKETYSLQSEIKIGDYKLNLNSRKIIKNEKVLDLTEREINLVIFLKNSPKPVRIEELQKEVWDYSSELETHTVETHIYRLRKKIKEKFNDDNFVISSKEGYLIC